MECACIGVGRHCAFRTSVAFDRLVSAKNERSQLVPDLPSPQDRSTRALASILANQIHPATTNLDIVRGNESRKGFKAQLRGARPTLACSCHRAGPCVGPIFGPTSGRRYASRNRSCRTSPAEIGVHKNGPVCGSTNGPPRSVSVRMYRHRILM